MNETWQELWGRDWPHRGRGGVVSCSRLDRLFQCPASIGIDDTRNEDEEDMTAAQMGTVMHYCLLEANDIPVDAPEEAEDLFFWCKSIIDSQLGELVQNEIYMETDVLTGSADILREDGRTLIVRDLKTGRIGVEAASKQLLGYAYLANRAFPNRWDMFDCGIIQPLYHGNTVPTVTYNLEEVEVFEGQLIEKLRQHHFGAGSSCRFCPAKATSQCQATSGILSVFGRKR